MSKIKLPDANFLASIVRFMKANKEKPCPGAGDGYCNKSTVLTAYALRNAGMKFDFYNGYKCQHGYPASGGAIGYMLDNYANRRTIKAPCDPSWKSLFQGTVAILMYHKVYGDARYNPLDIWCIDGSFQPELLEQGSAQSLWIWTLGNVTNSKITAKHSSHSAKHKLVIF